VSFKLSNGQGDEVAAMGTKAAAVAVGGTAAVLGGPMLQSAVVAANLGGLSTFAASKAGPFTVHFWAPMSKWLISGASFLDLNRPTDKISIAQYTALTLTGAFFTRYALLVSPVNYVLCSVNIALFISSAWQLGRKVKGEGAKRALQKSHMILKRDLLTCSRSKPTTSRLRRRRRCLTPTTRQQPEEEEEEEVCVGGVVSHPEEPIITRRSLLLAVNGEGPFGVMRADQCNIPATHSHTTHTLRTHRRYRAARGRKGGGERGREGGDAWMEGARRRARACMRVSGIERIPPAAFVMHLLPHSAFHVYM
jgi:hypothetical protein